MIGIALILALVVIAPLMIAGAALAFIVDDARAAHVHALDGETTR